MGTHCFLNEIALQRDIEQEKRKAADLSEQLDEKTRQLSKLQTVYERQRRRPLFMDVPQQTPETLPGNDGPYRIYKPMV